MGNYAQIVTFEEFDQIRDGLGRIVCTSGGFDPLHPGHATCIVESKQYGDTSLRKAEIERITPIFLSGRCARNWGLNWFLV